MSERHTSDVNAHLAARGRAAARALLAARAALLPVLGGAALAAGACSAGDAAEATPPETPAADASADARPRDARAEDAAAPYATHPPSEALRRCAVGRRELTSTVDAVARWSALGPADGPCVVASLPRPLAVVATRGMISAQPAEGEKSPRLFFLLPKLVVSAVPSGPGSKVVELGEWVTTSRTIKGELELPVPPGLAPGAAFEKVLDAQRVGTVCRGCHRAEEPHPGLEGAYASDAFEPEPGEFVTLKALAALHDACARDADDSPRCAMLHAVFDVGEVVQGEFGKDVGTFFFR